MKRLTMLITVAVGVFMLAAFSVAQMNMMSTPARDDKAQSSGQDSIPAMLGNMNSHYQTMSRSFDSLDRQFDGMMKMNNMAELKKAMRQHHEMMSSMGQSMMNQGNMWGQMMSMMGANGRMGHGGMMGSGGMMGNGSGEASENESHQDNFMNMMHNMNNHYRMMSQSFDSLDQQFNGMMKMNNMSELMRAMQQHHAMMSSMHKSMMNQGNMWGQMMSMMGANGSMGHGGMMGSGGASGNMMGGGMMGSGMMGNSSGESSGNGEHGHNH